jgi:hypothetical protein
MAVDVSSKNHRQSAADRSLTGHLAGEEVGTSRHELNVCFEIVRDEMNQGDLSRVMQLRKKSTVVNISSNANTGSD